MKIEIVRVPDLGRSHLGRRTEKGQTISEIIQKGAGVSIRFPDMDYRFYSVDETIALVADPLKKVPLPVVYVVLSVYTPQGLVYFNLDRAEKTLKSCVDHAGLVRFLKTGQKFWGKSVD